MHSLLLVVSSVASCLAQKATFPQNIELDLIFPRNNTVYAPTAHFPVVFAIQNAAIGWPYGLAIDWIITSDSPVGDQYTWTEVDFNSSTEALPSPGPFLLIGSTNKTNAIDSFALDFGFYINNASTDPTRDIYPFSIPVGNHSIITIPNTVYFSIAKGGIAPDVVVDGKCPQGVGMFVVESISTTDSGTYPIVNPTVYTISDPNNDLYPGSEPLYTSPEFNPCAMKVDKALASSVSVVLASQTLLPSATKY
ncbi:hypothetical protein N431DRAFT_337783 [Stipitochalara longipes BDJ]|nr:hypothetical protein N431DRAFT_337783 [Stipitochalara longipes BDJ]